MRAWWWMGALMLAGCGTAADEDAGSRDAGAGEACSEEALAACEYRPREHAVETLEGDEVENAALGRRFPILVRFPTDAEGPVPVIVASHGGSFNDFAG